MKDLALSNTAEDILAVIAQVTEVPEVRENLDLRLYDTDVLDSLKTVELIVAFSQQFGVDVSPAELERELWATPRLIVAFMQSKLAQ